MWESSALVAPFSGAHNDARLAETFVPGFCDVEGPESNRAGRLKTGPFFGPPVLLVGLVADKESAKEFARLHKQDVPQGLDLILEVRPSGLVVPPRP